MKVEVINRELIANAVNECSKIGPLLDENKNIAQVIELLEEKFDYELRKNSIEVEVGMTLADPKKHINWKIPTGRLKKIKKFLANVLMKIGMVTIMNYMLL